MSLCTEVEGLGGKGRSQSSAPSPRADCPPPVVHSGTEGRVGQDYVSSELALPCARLGMDTLPQGTPALQRRAPQGGDASAGAAALAAPWRIVWPGAGAPVVLGPAPGVPRVLHCVLCCALHCVPHCVLRCVLHCVLRCVLYCVQ